MNNFNQQEEHDKIAKELKNYRRNIILIFNNTFSPITYYYPSGTKEGGTLGYYNYYHLNIVPIEGGRDNIVSITLLYKDTVEDFWYRWNRFKKLRAFL